MMKIREGKMRLNGGFFFPTSQGASGLLEAGKDKEGTVYSFQFTLGTGM